MHQFSRARRGRARRNSASKWVLPEVMVRFVAHLLVKGEALAAQAIELVDCAWEHMDLRRKSELLVLALSPAVIARLRRGGLS